MLALIVSCLTWPIKQQTLLRAGPACRYHTFFASDCFLQFLKHIYHLFLLALGNVFLKMPFGSCPLQRYEQSFLPYAISMEWRELSPWVVMPSPTDSSKSGHCLFRRIWEKTKNTSCLQTPFTAGWN